MALYHVYSIPSQFLDNLTPRGLVNLPTEPLRPLSPDPVLPLSTALRSCNVCLGATFSDLREQRAHFRSDWHRYNVKTRLKGGAAVNESAFSHLIEGTSTHYSLHPSPLTCFQPWMTRCLVLNLHPMRTILASQTQSIIWSTNHDLMEGLHPPKLPSGLYRRPPFLGSILPHPPRLAFIERSSPTPRILPRICLL